MKTLKDIVEQINALASDYQMGQFQEIRQKLHGLSRVRSYDIFTDQTTFDTYAYHSGGRKELQFNIGFTGEQEEWFRYGVAFSLDPSKTLPDPLILKPKILKLNQFFLKNRAELEDLRFWYHSAIGGRSPIFPAKPVSESQIKLNTFLFWGKLSKRDEANPREVLFLFDRLLILYEYTEGNKPLTTVSANLKNGFQFKSGATLKADFAIQSTKSSTRTIQLRHNKLQKALFELLASQFGEGNVGEENDTGRGSRIDLVVRNGNEHIYYEIKTYPDIRTCIREAISQLMEYSYWPGGNSCERMIIVSENPITADAKHYLETLRNSFRLPIYYQQLDVTNKSLGKPE